MPITPKEALDLYGDDKQILADVQKKIDKFVLEKFQGDYMGTGGSIEVPIDREIPIKFKIKRQIANNYIQAGWKQAEFKGDDKFYLSTYEKGNSYFER